MKQFADRKYIFIGLVVLVCFLYTVRLFYIQIVEDKYQLSAKNQAFRFPTDYPIRGYIYDRNGKLLVYNEAAYDLMVTPKQVKEDLDTNDLCSLLGITKETFLKKMLKAIQAPNSPRKPSIFEKQISAMTYAALQEKLYKFHGFYVQSRTLRKYPLNTAAHLLGYIGEVSKSITEKNPYYKEGDYIGMSGIEKAYEEELRGVKGKKVIMVDVHNREKGSFENGKYDTLAIPGKNLTSSLDGDLQMYGEVLMQNKIGGAVAIEPSTGEVLALVASPSYDPNLLVGRARSSNYAVLARDSARPLYNRALQGKYPPGSTFKLINALIGQQEGVLFPETRYPCARGYPVMGGRPACHAHSSPLDLKGSVQHSCNSYYAFVFRSIIDNKKKYNTVAEGYMAWKEYVLSFGVGKSINSDLPHELKGFVPSVEYYDKYFGKNQWKSSTIVSLSIGQGELLVTPLQMANIMATIANRGYYYIPHVIRYVGDKKYIKPEFTKKNYTKIDQKYFDVIIDGMQQVVDAGTGRVAKLDSIIVCGKTGTAENPHGKDHSVFVAFAPRDNPKIAIAVLVENAGFGAQWAAPIASLMIEKYLTGKITRPELEKRMVEGNLIKNKDKVEEKKR